MVEHSVELTPRQRAWGLAPENDELNARIFDANSGW